jgi:hypothetical protein
VEASNRGADAQPRPIATDSRGHPVTLLTTWLCSGDRPVALDPFVCSNVPCTQCRGRSSLVQGRHNLEVRDSAPAKAEAVPRGTEGSGPHDAEYAGDDEIDADEQ